MKLKWWLLLGVFGGFIIGPLIAMVPGSTYILLKDTALEFNNSFALTMLLLLLLLAWALGLLIRYLLKTSNLTIGWFGDRHLRKARQNTIDGMIALSEGHWKTAELLLLKGAQIPDSRLINYLAAARAAQEQNNDKKRDDYLKSAAHAQPEAQIAVGLTQAQLQIQHKQYEQALATLNHLRNLSPHHPYVLKLLNQLYIKLGDWKHIIELTPKLKKNRVLSKEALLENESNAWCHLLEQENQLAGFLAAQQQYHSIPKPLAKLPAIQLTFAKILAEHQQDDQLEIHIKDALKLDWQEPLAQLFGEITSQQPSKTLATAEQWLKQRPNNTTLLICLGKLSLKAKLWGKAKSYLEHSLASEQRAEAYFYLAQAFEQLGHPINAQQQYQLGLLQSVKPLKKDNTLSISHQTGLNFLIDND